MKTTTIYASTQALLSIFAGGCITILFIIVPFWHTLSPEAFLRWFTNFGPRIGIVMLPMEVIPLVFSAIAYFHAVKHDPERKTLWLFVNVSNIIILLTFFIYFLPVNFSFLNHTIDGNEVSTELKRWEMMHVCRTALSLLSAAIPAFMLSRSTIK